MVPAWAPTRFFFFFSYEGFRLRQGQAILRSVPTEAIRNGDFSNVRNAQGNLIPIYDPATCGALGNPACASTTALRTPFANNTVPGARFDKTASILRSLWALPNQPEQQFTNISNFAANSSTGGNNDQIHALVDHTVSDRQRLFGRYTRWSDLNLPSDPYKSNTRTDVNFLTQQVVATDTYMLSPTMVFDLRAAFFRFRYNSLPESTGSDFTTFGWPASLNSQVQYRQIPYRMRPELQRFLPGGDRRHREHELQPLAEPDQDRGPVETTSITERMGLQFRTEFFNLFNRVQFANPNLSAGNPSFGVVSSQTNTPRLIHFALLMY